MRRTAAITAIVLVALFASPSLRAQEFPSRSISVILPYSVGGPFDVILRQLAELIRPKLGRSVIIESKPGGATLIATRHVRQAPADGHTILLQTGLLGLNTLVFKDAGYELGDFVPLVSLATNPYVLYVNERVPASNLKELVSYAAANPDKLNMGDYGSIGTVQILMDELMEAGKFKATQIPYKGASDMTAALLAGDIQLMFSAVGPGKPFVDAGKLKAIAIAQDERSPLFPDVPTFKEQGMPKVNGSTYIALFVRTGTPDEVVKRLRDAIGEAMQTKEYRERIASIGTDPWPMSADALRDFIQQDFDVWKTRLGTK
jgi:tripartite-type tricarboxylate transporter receptor subunit TctC